MQNKQRQLIVLLRRLWKLVLSSLKSGRISPTNQSKRLAILSQIRQLSPKELVKLPWLPNISVQEPFGPLSKHQIGRAHV